MRSLDNAYFSGIICASQRIDERKSIDDNYTQRILDHNDCSDKEFIEVVIAYKKDNNIAWQDYSDIDLSMVLTGPRDE